MLIGQDHIDESMGPWYETWIEGNIGGGETSQGMMKMQRKWEDRRWKGR